jgi:hypothetical protein
MERNFSFFSPASQKWPPYMIKKPKQDFILIPGGCEPNSRVWSGICWIQMRQDRSNLDHLKSCNTYSMWALWGNIHPCGNTGHQIRFSPVRSICTSDQQFPLLLHSFIHSFIWYGLKYHLVFHITVYMDGCPQLGSTEPIQPDSLVVVQQHLVSECAPSPVWGIENGAVSKTDLLTSWTFFWMKLDQKEWVSMKTK